MPGKQRALTEQFFSRLTPITEAAGEAGSPPKRMKVRGLAQRADVVNGNRRVYPREVLSREVSRIQEAISARRVFMAVDHPSSGSAPLKDAGAILTGLTMEGQDVYFEAEILNTDAGKVVREIVSAGGQVGVSSRGLGTTKTESRDDGSVEIVENDYQFVTIDFVGEPSLAAAGIRSHVEEAKGGSLKMEVKTLKDLEEKFPELAEALRKESRAAEAAKLEPEIQEKVIKPLEEKIAALRDDVRKEVLKEMEGKDETQGKTGIGYFALGPIIQAMLAKAGFNVPLEAVNSLMQADDAAKKQGLDGVAGRQSGYGSAPGAGDPTAAGQALEAMKKSQASLMEKVVTLEADLRKKEIDAFVESEVKKFPASIQEDIRTRLKTCESLDEAKVAAATELKHIETIAKKIGAPAGKGRQFAPDPVVTEGQDPDEARKAQLKRLSGVQ